MSLNRSKGYIYVIASAIIYGCMPLGAKIIYADGVTPFTLVLLRNLLSLPILALLVILGGESLAIKPKRLLKVSSISIFGSCITPVLLYVSYQHIPSGNATVFHFIYPAAVVLAELVIFREKTDWRSLLCVALCVGAVSLFWRGTRLIGGSRSSILSAFEPTVSVIIAIFFLKDQQATVFNITGSLLVILSTVLIALFDMKRSESN